MARIAPTNKKETTDKDAKFIRNKVCEIIPDDWYDAKIKKATDKGKQIENELILFNHKNPEQQHKSIRMWLDKEYMEGDVTDEFFNLFPDVDNIKKLHGKEFKAFIQEIEGRDGNYYLRVTEIEALN